MGDFLYICIMGIKKWSLESIEKLIQDNEIKTKKEFRVKFSGAHSAALENKWMSRLEKYFTTRGNKFLRGVYRYMFSDGHTYTGLTDNFERRHKEHMTKGPVYIHMVTTGLTPIKLIISEYVDSNVATYLESNDWDFLVSEGYKPLQPRPQKQLGGTDVKWTLHVAKSIVKHLDSVYDFRKQQPSLYTTASQKGWLEELTQSLSRRKVDRTKQECIDDIINNGYRTKNDFIKGSPRVYDSLMRNKWWEEVSKTFFPKNTLMKSVLNTETGVYYDSVKEACLSQDKYIYTTFKNHLNPNRNRGVNNTPFIIID